MVTINLLPVKQIKKIQKGRTELLGFAATLLLLLAAMGLTGGIQIAMIKGLNNNIKGLEKEKSSYQATITVIENLKKEKAKLETMLEMIKKLRKGSHITVRVMDEIASMVPENRLWLQSFTQTPANLKLTGVALDNETIAQFMQRLKSSKYFTSAELGSSALTVVADRKLKSFTLSCDLVNLQPAPPPKAAPPAKPAGKAK